MEEKILTEEDFVFTPEQQEKLAKLRSEKELEIKRKGKNIRYQAYDSFYKKDAPVYILIEGTKFSGYILDVVTDKKSKKTTYTVNSGHGVLKGIGGYQITGRIVQDLSNIIVPEVLQKMSAYGLLKLLKSARLSGYYNEYWGNRQDEVKFSVEQIKAALKGKSHVPTKREKKVVKKYQ